MRLDWEIVSVFTSQTRVPHKQLAFVTCALEKSTPFAQNLATLYLHRINHWAKNITCFKIKKIVLGKSFFLLCSLGVGLLTL